MVEVLHRWTSRVGPLRRAKSFEIETASRKSLKNSFVSVGVDPQGLSGCRAITLDRLTYNWVRMSPILPYGDPAYISLKPAFGRVARPRHAG
jgi:hypothetical protein